MERDELAERAFAQTALLNIVVQGILETLKPDQVAKVRTHLLEMSDRQAAFLVSSSTPDAVPDLFATLVEQMQLRLRDLLASPSGRT